MSWSERRANTKHSAIRVAAADAAAQAVLAYRRAGLRGAAMNASATIHGLATEAKAPKHLHTGGDDPSKFTDRQHEIISLAAQGLSNKEIADRARHVETLRRGPSLPRLPTRRSQHPRTADLDSQRRVNRPKVDPSLPVR